MNIDEMLEKSKEKVEITISTDYIKEDEDDNLRDYTFNIVIEMGGVKSYIEIDCESVMQAKWGRFLDDIESCEGYRELLYYCIGIKYRPEIRCTPDEIIFFVKGGIFAKRNGISITLDRKTYEGRICDIIEEIMEIRRERIGRIFRKDI